MSLLNHIPFSRELGQRVSVMTKGQKVPVIYTFISILSAESDINAKLFVLRALTATVMVYLVNPALSSHVQSFQSENIARKSFSPIKSQNFVGKSARNQKLEAKTFLHMTKITFYQTSDDLPKSFN